MDSIFVTCKKDAIRTFMIVLSGVLLVGCQPAPGDIAADRTSVPAKNASTSSKVDGQRRLDQRLSKGMSYADMRNLVLGEGWIPVPDPQCTANVVGADYKPTCTAHPGLDACNICNKLPELSSCSGDAYCGMYFSKGLQRLHIVAFGDIRDWDVGGDRSEFTVSGWDSATR